jgi:MarR family transcriptional regulator, transcriptional regulator for hemolysin
MTPARKKYLPLGRMFSYLTKQYISEVARKMEGTPVSRYYFPLYMIGVNSGAISQQELADRLLMDKVSLVRILDCLAEDGFIRREADPADRRKHLLFATEKALPWIDRIEKALRDTDDHFLSYLKDGERFHASLGELVQSTSGLQANDVELFYKRTNPTQE